MNDVSGNKVIVFCILTLALGVFLGHALWTKTVYSDGEDLTTKIENAVRDAITIKDVEIENLKKLIESSENVTEDEIEEIEVKGYLVDGLYLETGFNDTYSDREIDLFDGEVEFDGDRYDAEEVLILNGLVLKANEKDFEGISYLTIPTNTIKFKLNFENDLNTSLIGEETLKFNLFNQEVEVIDWDGDEITFTKGTEYFLSEGESITFEEKNIVLEMVLEDAVYVLVDDVGGKIEEDKTKTINGIEIKVKEVLYSGYSGGYAKATLTIGEEVEVTIESGDEYEEDSIWEWVIDEHSIGLILVEEFTELDEEFNALGIADKVCLPNDYVCVQFNGIIEEDTEEYTFELSTKNFLEYVRVEGNFQKGIEDYTRIYVNAVGIYDRDMNLIGQTVELGDFSLLDVSSGKIVIEDFEVDFDLNVTNVGSHDYDYLTDYGILVEDTEEAIEEQEIKILVPENQLEAEVLLI